MYKKKAAMFGLDARIALAIFGSLSVITGAALYSVIQQSETIATVAELNEVTKAIESYIIDTRKYLENRAENSESLHVSYLINEPAGIKRWKGPYIQHEIRSDNQCLKTTYLDNVCLDIFKLDTTPFDTGSECKQSSTTKCVHWLTITEPDIDVLRNIEKYLDGTQNPGNSSYTGKFFYDSAYNLGMLKTGIPYPPRFSKTP